MNIHEHQAKAVLSEFGVAVPRGFPAFTVEEAVQAAEKSYFSLKSMAKVTTSVLPPPDMIRVSAMG